MGSVWKEWHTSGGFEALKGDLNTDVLIIGGGLAGLLCAYMLNRRGADYALVEADTVCGGVTENTTAKKTSQHGLIYSKIAKEFNIETASMYLHANEEALEKYREICAGIDCDFEEADNYVYSLNDEKAIDDEIAAARAAGFPAEKSDCPELPFKVAGGVKFAGQARFNPLKFASAIQKGLHIYEHTAVENVNGTEAYTSAGKIRTKKIIVATHFPFINIRGMYFMKMYQHRSYVIALENAQKPSGMYVDEAQTGLSFRNYGNLLLLGGGSHRTGKQGGGYDELRRFASKHYPEAREVCAWATQDCMTLDGIPYIGRYSKGDENTLVATGFNKWGMTSSMIAATILCDMALGQENRYASVFDPSRTMLRPMLAVNCVESAINLITPTAPRCTHMGCALKWNKSEHTWDCPCHGSRFTAEGDVINNPARKRLNGRHSEE